jgi:hypothetical protein
MTAPNHSAQGPLESKAQDALLRARGPTSARIVQPSQMVNCWLGVIPVPAKASMSDLIRADCNEMFRPGDPYASAFVAEVGRCWAMIYDRRT